MNGNSESTNGEIARRIDTHLERLEGNPIIDSGLDNQGGRYVPRCWWNGRAIGITYGSNEFNAHFLDRQEALDYLTRLDAGYVGRHFEATEAKEEEMVKA